MRHDARMAFGDQAVDETDGEPLDREAMAEVAQAQVPQEDLDLERVYLNQITRRKLLTARQEQDIGRRIEVARGDLTAALGSIPVARQTLFALADDARRDAAPAAELILLPDGGEPTPEKLAPIMRGFARLRRLERALERCQKRLTGRRATAASGATARAAIAGCRERAAARGCQARADRTQPAPRRVDRQAIPRTWPVASRFDSGRQHRLDEGGRAISISPRIQVLDLWHVVDPPGHHPRGGRLRPHDPAAGSRDRVAQSADAGAEGVPSAAWPGAPSRGTRRLELPIVSAVTARGRPPSGVARRGAGEGGAQPRSPARRDRHLSGGGRDPGAARKGRRVCGCDPSPTANGR